MTHPTDDSLKPCPFCGSQPEPAPYVLKCVNAYCEAQPSVSGGNDDECATAWNKRALLAEQARTQTHKAEDAPTLLEAFKSGKAILIDWPMEPVTPQEALKLMDMMDAEYAKTMGKPAPDREMAVCMQRVQHMACDLWASQKEVIRAHFVELDAAQSSTVAEDAPSDAELLDSRGNIRSDLKSSAYCVGNEYKPFHPRASHVRPEWRDGWNACFVAAIAQERKA